MRRVHQEADETRKTDLIDVPESNGMFHPARRKHRHVVFREDRGREADDGGHAVRGLGRRVRALVERAKLGLEMIAQRQDGEQISQVDRGGRRT